MLDTGAIDRADWQRARTARVVLRDTLRSSELARAVLQGAGAPGARRALRLGAGLPGRAARVHDDRHGRAGRRRGVGGAVAEGPRRETPGAARARDEPRANDARRQRRRPAAGRAHRDGSAHRPRARDGRRPRLRREPLQPRRAGAPAARLGVQAVRVRRGARGRVHARDDPRPPERSDGDAAGRLDAGRRTLDGRIDDAAHGAPDVEQPRRRAAAAAGRHPADGRVRQSRWASATCPASRRSRSGPARSRCSR